MWCNNNERDTLMQAVQYCHKEPMDIFVLLWSSSPLMQYISTKLGLAVNDIESEEHHNIINIITSPFHKINHNKRSISVLHWSILYHILIHVMRLILRKLLTWLSAMLPSDHLIQLWGRTCSSWWQTPGCSPSTQLQPALLGLVRGLELLLHLLDLFIDQFSTQGDFFLLSSIFLFMEVTLAPVVDVKPSFSLKAFAVRERSRKQKFSDLRTSPGPLWRLHTWFDLFRYRLVAQREVESMTNGGADPRS